MSITKSPMSLPIRLLMGCALLLGAATSPLLSYGQEPASLAALAGQKKVTVEELKAMLVNLGYEPEVDMVGGKVNLLYVQWKQGTFQFVLYVSVSADGNDMIIQAPLKTLPADESAYGKQLAAIMAKGFYLTPSHFVVDDSRMLRMIRFVPNQDLNTAKLRKIIGDFTEQVRTSESVWRADQWGTTPATVTTPAAVVKLSDVGPVEAAKPVVETKVEHKTPVIWPLQGTWKVKSLNGNGVAFTKESLDARKLLVKIDKDKLSFSENGVAAHDITLRAGEGERTIDFINPAGQIEKGIYSCEGGTTKIAFAAPGGERPTNFQGKSGVTVLELELVR